MSAHNFLNLLNKLGKRHKNKAQPSMLTRFCTQSDKFNITGAQKLESILPITQKNTLKSHFGVKSLKFCCIHEALLLS